MFSDLRDKRRHRRLMLVATELVREAELNATRTPESVTSADVAIHAFGQYRIRPSEPEAADYLAAVLVARGHSAAHLPAIEISED